MITMPRSQGDWIASMCEDAVAAAIGDVLTDLSLADLGVAPELTRRLKQCTSRAVSDVFAATADPEILLQRIEHIEGGVAIGYEALARFGEAVDSATVFAKAGEHGVGVRLELTTLIAAAARLDELPPEAYLGLNLSSDALVDEGVCEVLDRIDLSRVVIELTQQSQIVDVQDLRRRFAALQNSGAIVAVDGAGVGFFKGARLVELQPEMIKISSTFVSGCDTSEEKRAELASLIAVGRRIGATVVATGVERIEERNVVASLGVDAVQGYLIGRPMPEVQVEPARALAPA